MMPPSQNKKAENKHAFIMGLALFSMFFGSGNLIFPFAVGRFAQGYFSFGALGFIVTAVLVPFLGVLAMLIYDGDYERFFNFAGKRLGFLITLILLSFWIPLGSGPRCITLSHASFDGMLPMPPLWLFSLFYTSLVFILTYKRARMLDVLGYVLTPLLLLTLGIVVTAGMWQTKLPLAAPPVEAADVFWRGALEGYNTMDLIAAFFFSSTIIRFVKKTIAPPKKPRMGEQGSHAPIDRNSYLMFAAKAFGIGITILALVYLGLMYVAASHAPLLAEVSKDRLLPTLAHALLGAQLGGLASLAIALACLTTSLALAAVYADFLRLTVCQGRINQGSALGLTSLLTWAMSTLGFADLAQFSEPIFQVFYPSLMILIFVLVGIKCWQAWSHSRLAKKVTTVES